MKAHQSRLPVPPKTLDNLHLLGALFPAGTFTCVKCARPIVVAVPDYHVNKCLPQIECSCLSNGSPSEARKSEAPLQLHKIPTFLTFDSTMAVCQIVPSATQDPTSGLNQSFSLKLYLFLRASYSTRVATSLL